MTVDWVLDDRIPTPREHRQIAESVGWHDAFDWATVPDSLAGSTLGVVASVDGHVVGMGRVVGDGVKYFYIQDLAVDPAHQGNGLGRAVLERILALIARRAPAPAFVALFATAEGAPLYESAGFAARDMTGLFMIVE